MRNVTILLAVAAVLALAVPASAAVLVETNFDGQAVGALYGQSTGGSDVGLTGTWGGTTGTTAPYATVVATNVSYSNGEVSIDGGANAVRIRNGTLTNFISLANPIAPGAVDDTLYMGLLFHFTGTVGGGTEYNYTYLGAGTSRYIAMGIEDDAPGDLYGSIGAGTDGGPQIADETLYIVAKVVAGVDAADWTTPAWVSMQLFWNPDNLDESSATNLYYDVAAYDRVDTASALGFRSYGIDTVASGDEMLVSYVVVGDTWGDVVVPEPATMVLLGIGGIGVLIRRRRR